MKNYKLLILSILFMHTISFAQNYKMAVTIDDLPFQHFSKYTTESAWPIFQKLVSNIKSQDTYAIGFVNENKLLVNGEYDSTRIGMLKLWLNNDLDLGNHTFSHPSLNKVDRKEFEENIIKGEFILRPLLANHGKELKYFRYPFLHTGLTLETKHAVEEFLAKKNYRIAPVSIDNSEWIFAAAYQTAFDKIDSSMMTKIADEYIVYMNDKIAYWEAQSKALFDRNINHVLLIHANRLNADFYPSLIHMIQQRGYSFITLDKALSDPAYKSEDKFIKNNGISQLHRWAYTLGKKKEFYGNEPVAPNWVCDYAGIEYE